MPTRPVSALILIGWALATFGLLQRDVLPDLRTTPPPDLRSLADAERIDRTTRWNMSVADDPSLRMLRPVGRATTRTEHPADGSTVLSGRLVFDSDNLLRRTPLASWLSTDPNGPERHVQVDNSCQIDPSGNLDRFHVEVRLPLTGDAPYLTVDARVEDRRLLVTSRGIASVLDRQQSFPYEARGMIQNGLGAIDQLPGLQVGQRWQNRIVSPITGQLETVTTEVTGKHTLSWNGSVVTTLLVVQKMGTMKARTWVRPDGLVIRQEVPFPFVRLVLERIPEVEPSDEASAVPVEAKSR